MYQLGENLVIFLKLYVVYSIHEISVYEVRSIFCSKIEYSRVQKIPRLRYFFEVVSTKMEFLKHLVRIYVYHSRI